MKFLIVYFFALLEVRKVEDRIKVYHVYCSVTEEPVSEIIVSVTRLNPTYETCISVGIHTISDSSIRIVSFSKTCKKCMLFFGYIHHMQLRVL